MTIILSFVGAGNCSHKETKVWVQFTLSLCVH